MTIPDEAVQAMPERIYAKTHGASTDVISGQRGLIGGWNEHKRDGQIEFVRADLALPFLTGVKVNNAKIETIGRYEARYCEDIPTDCCDYGVVDISAGIEVCRVWKEEDARRIAELLNGYPAPSPRAQALEEIISELKEAERKIFSWSGSAFVANELEGAEDGNCKSELYSDLCKLGNVMYWLQTQVRTLSSQPVADGWLPIETAPKDGTPFLVFVPDDKFSDGTGIDVIWYDEEQWLFGSNTPFVPANNPTHWRPLPASPGASE